MHILAVLFALLQLSVCLSVATCPTGPIINDGGFESGVIPPRSGGSNWNVGGFVGDSTYTLTTPGSPNNGGNVKFTATLVGGYRTGGQSAETLTQTMHTCAGQNYSISVDYTFNSTASNLCSLKIEYPYKTTAGSVTVNSGLGIPGTWDTTGSTFQAVSNADILRIIFGCNGGAAVQISVDNVKVAKFNGNAF